MRALFVAVALLAVAAPSAVARDTVRFSTFNASLNRNNAGELLPALRSGTDPQIRNVAETIQRVRPDVLLINEFDFFEGGEALRLFQQNYLSVSQRGAQPIEFPHTFVAPSNTGIHSGHDLNNNGAIVSVPDALGYGD